MTDDDRRRQMMTDDDRRRQTTTDGIPKLLTDRYFLELSEMCLYMVNLDLGPFLSGSCKKSVNSNPIPSNLQNWNKIFCFLILPYSFSLLVFLYSWIEMNFSYNLEIFKIFRKAFRLVFIEKSLFQFRSRVS